MGKVIAIIVVALLVVGVSVIWYMNNNGAYAPQTSPSPTSTVTDTPASTDATDEEAQVTGAVSIANMAFGPTTITVKKGETVTWTNNDSMVHTVTAVDGQAGPDSGNLNQGETYNYTFDSTGTFEYYCALHPAMTGTVIVTE